MIKFTPILNKNANFYYFLHNFSKIEEPFHYRKWNILIWKKELSLTKSDQIVLSIFKKIYYKYFPKVYLGKYFFLKRQPWKFLKKKVFQKDINILRKIFDIWKEKFELIYNKDLPNLKKWKVKIEQESKKMNELSLNASINTKLSKFYNVAPYKGEINVYLMLCGLKNNASGERGRGLNKKSILVELSRCSIDKINYILGIIWHEIIHSYFEVPYLHPLLLNFFKNHLKILFIEEMIARSLFPAGIFGAKFFKTPIPSTLTSSKWETFPRINAWQTIKIINLCNQYFEKDRKIDPLFIRKIKQILKI